MIKINNKYLDKFANEHCLEIKKKIGEDFQKKYKYSIEEILTAKPEELEEIATWAEQEQEDYKFMIAKYNNFATKKKEYNAYDLAKKLNINVCPYCNINSTYTIIKGSKRIIRPEFDHFYDKVTYPILALSFYNLIPSCHTCNSSLKRTANFLKKPHINPYDDRFDFNHNAKFRVKIKNVDFYNNEKSIKLTCKIKENTTDDEKLRIKNNIKDFKLFDLYQNHKDIAIELIQKTLIYNESYIDELYQNYEGTLFKNREDVLKLISGGYVEDEDIGKRPLSKLIKDIGDYLGLL